MTTTDSAHPGANHTNVGAGEFKGLLNGNSFVTYCTDLFQTFAFNTTYNDYSVVNGVTAWGGPKSTILDHVISYAIDMGMPSNAKSSAVVQAAVWEVINESAPGWPGMSFSAGNFKVTSATGSVQTALNGFDWAAAMSHARTHHVDQLFSRSHQDFMVVSEVPEPGTYAMLLAGLAGMGFVARRRSR